MMSAFFSLLRTLVRPPRCTACGAKIHDTDLFLCVKCLGELRPVVSHTIKITRRQKMRVYASCAYHGPLKKLILRKYQRRIFASHDLAHIMWRTGIAPQLSCTVMVPVPMHWTRYVWRGFNQSKEIACVLARYKKCPCVPLVRRIRYTRLQARLSKNERQNNVRRAFCLTGTSHDLNKYRGAHIVLVDDLATTGGTLREVARALLPLRPASICAVVACRAV